MNNSINAEVWLNYIENEIGFVLPKTQHRWLSNAIMATAKNNSLTVQQLWLAIQTDHRLRQQLFDAVLILESRFFRHLPSLQYVATLAAEYIACNSISKVDDNISNNINTINNVAINKSYNTISSSSKNTRQRNYKSLSGSRLANEGNGLTNNNQRQVANTLSSLPNILNNNSMATQDSLKPFQIWSVGCSKGQEVWSLAMMLDENHITDYQILGTDISKQAIRQAATACYTARERAFIPYPYQHYMIDINNGEQVDNLTAERWQVTAKLRKQVQFTYHNIFTPKMPTTILQNVIICQNVLIYFRQFDQRDILARLVTQCQLGGHIILAPGEAISWHHPKMQRVSHPDVNAWCKVKA